jgi:chromosome segregation ATPase
MSFSDLLDRIAMRQKQRAQRRVSDYRDLVAQVADGKEPDADCVARVLADNDKTVSDLAGSVNLLLARRSLRMNYDQLPALAKERSEVEKRIAEADTILAKAEEKHEATATPLYGRLSQIKRATADAERARKELQDSCPDADLCAQLEDVRSRLTAAHNRRAELERECSSLRDWIAIDRDNAGRARSVRAEQLTEQANRREARLRQFEAEIENLRRQIPELEKQERQVRERMLEP